MNMHSKQIHMIVNSETNKENQKNSQNILILMNPITIQIPKDTVNSVVKKQHMA